MKVEFNLEKGYCKVTKEKGDKRYSNGGYAQAESTFLYHVLQHLKAQGHDVIKKRMWRDGHMVSDTQQYIRTRKWTGSHPDEFCIWNTAYAIYDLGEEFNSRRVGESLYLSVEK